MKLTYSLLAAAFACGLASAQTAYTTPVGYETLGVSSGFNYLGLRLHSPITHSGTFEVIAATSLTDTGASFTVAANKTYIVEINDGSGIITQVLGSAIAGDTISTSDNLLAAGVASGASYSIREASTISGIFGAENSAGLVAGFGGITGADVIFVPNGSGGFDQFYFDSLENSWADVNGLPVDGSIVPLVYADGVVISANSALSLTVSGEVKKQPVALAAGSGFNYLSSIYPAGATLASTFDGVVGSLDQGFGGITGADVFFVPNGLGGFSQYYFDSLENSWADVNGLPVDASLVALPSGLLFSNEGGSVSLKASPPASYSSL